MKERPFPPVNSEMAEFTFPIPPSEGELPETQRKVGYNAAGVLRTLEAHQGYIQTDRFNALARDFLENKDTDSSGYSKSLDALAQKGYVDVDREGRVVKAELLPAGYCLIALFKAYPDIVRQPPQPRLDMSTSFKILEHIIEEAVMVDAQENRWLFPVGSVNQGTSYHLGLHLNMSDDSITRRLYSMREDKEFLITEVDADSHINAVTNIAATPKGVKHYEAVLDRHREKEGELPHKDLIDKVDEVVDNGMKLANQLGDRGLLKVIMTLASPSEITEMNQEQLKARFEEIEATIAEASDYYIQNAA